MKFTEFNIMNTKKYRDTWQVNADPSNLSNLGIQEIPKNLPINSNALYMSFNQIKVITTRISILTKLKYLFMNNNIIEIIPKYLPVGLEYLNLNDNNIEHIPAYLPKNLRSLNLSGNKITIIPESLPATLRILTLDYNKINEIPKRLPPNLEDLSLVNNEIIKLPNTYPYSLKTLNLYRNNISSLKPTTHLANLDSLNLDGNRRLSKLVYKLEVDESWQDFVMILWSNERTHEDIFALKRALDRMRIYKKELLEISWSKILNKGCLEFLE